MVLLLTIDFIKGLGEHKGVHITKNSFEWDFRHICLLKVFSYPKTKDFSEVTSARIVLSLALCRKLLLSHPTFQFYFFHSEFTPKIFKLFLLYYTERNFSIKCALLPWGDLAMSGDIFDFHNLRACLPWHLVRGDWGSC